MQLYLEGTLIIWQMILLHILHWNIGVEPEMILYPLLLIKKTYDRGLKMAFTYFMLKQGGGKVKKSVKGGAGRTKKI